MSIEHSPTIRTVMSAFLNGQRIHRYDSRNEAGTESLHSIVSILRNHKGWPIKDKWVWALDAVGRMKHVKLYWLPQEEIKRLRGEL